MNVIYSITEYGSIQVLTINTLRDEWKNRQILKTLHQKINSEKKYFIVDMSQLSLISSSGLNFLLSLLSMIQDEDGTLVLANVSTRVVQVLDITKLLSVFEIQSSIDVAIQHFSLQLAA